KAPPPRFYRNKTLTRPSPKRPLMSLIDTLRFSLWGMLQARASGAPPRRVRALQERRLRRLLRHAAARSPFYRDRCGGLARARCTLADLPVTTKGALTAHFDEVVPAPQVRRADLEQFLDAPANVNRLFLGRYPVCHTSGSQGQSLLVVQDRLALHLL